MMFVADVEEGGHPDTVKASVDVVQVNSNDLQFLCGTFRRYHSMVVGRDAVPVSLTSFCQTPRYVYPDISGPYLVVVKEVMCSQMHNKSGDLRAFPFEPYVHIHPLRRLEYLRHLVTLKMGMIAELEARRLMTLTTLDVRARPHHSGNGLSSISPNASAGTFPRVDVRAPVLPTIHATLHEPSRTLVQFQQYIPSQSLEQIIQERFEVMHVNGGSGSGGTTSGSGEASRSSGSPQRLATIVRTRPVAVVTMSIIREVLKCLQTLHAHDIPHQHLRPSSVLLLISAWRGSDQYHTWLDNVGHLNTRSPLQDPDLWRWYAPEVTRNDLVFAEANGALSAERVAWWKKCDVCAVGLLLYFLLTGQRPFDEDLSSKPISRNRNRAPYETYVTHMMGSRQQEDLFKTFGIPNAGRQTQGGSDVRTRNPHGIKLEELMTRCVAWNPADRPLVSQLLDEIETLLQSHPNVEECTQEAIDGPVQDADANEVSDAECALPPLPLPIDNAPAAPHAAMTRERLVGSASTDAHYHSSSDNAAAGIGSFLYFRPGATLQHLPPFATASEANVSTGIPQAAGSELNQGGCSRYFLSQCQADNLIGCESTVKEMQSDAKELRNRILTMCFPEDRPFAINPLQQHAAVAASPAHHGLVALGATSNWQGLAHKFHLLIASPKTTERYYPNRSELVPLFRRLSLAQRIWSFDIPPEQNRQELTLSLPRNFVLQHLGRVSSDSGSYSGSFPHVSGTSGPRHFDTNEVSLAADGYPHTLLKHNAYTEAVEWRQLTILQSIWTYLLAAFAFVKRDPSHDAGDDAAYLARLKHQKPHTVLLIQLIPICLLGVAVAVATAAIAVK
jgi:hypothetical protein